MTEPPIKTFKKLIEVALPLEAINEESSARKRKAPAGYPTTLHKWWAQRPLAAARAVIFSQMVDDPSEYVDVLKQDTKLRRKAESALKEKKRLWQEAEALYQKTKGTGVDTPEPGPEPTLDEVIADQERQRLFRIIEDLVQWENTTNEMVVQAARDEIWASWRRTCVANAGHPRAKELFDRHKLPAFHDPFAGGGSLPLEAQRLGLEVYASDLNPVAVLINKAMIEIPPKFAGRPPVNPEARRNKELIAREWKGAQGLAEDVRYYGKWMRDEAEKRIGHLYPKIEVTAAMAKERNDLKPYVGQKLTVIAWIWARTVKSPNPAFSSVRVPLVSTFQLSTTGGRESYVDTLVDGKGYSFSVRTGMPKNVERVRNGTKLPGANFLCIMSGSPIAGDYIKAEAQAGRMGARLMAMVALGRRERLYLSPTEEAEKIAASAEPEWKPAIEISGSGQYIGVRPYGMGSFGDLFTGRQALALSTFTDLVKEARGMVESDLASSGSGELRQSKDLVDYSSAVAVYLAMAVSRLADYGSSLATWRPKDNAMRSSLPMQALQMTWGFAEGSPFGSSSSGFEECVKVVSRVLVESLGLTTRGVALQASAAADSTLVAGGSVVFSTDPPYYDNVPFADLSDFFYVWLRHSLNSVYPELFNTLAVPKAEELVAFAYRHESKSEAEKFFLAGMTEAMCQLAERTHPNFPITIYYAFKQAERDDAEGGSVSTGWETFLGAVIAAGLSVTGTWPMRTESDNRQRGVESNALASSIVLACRRRPSNAPTATRGEFVSALNSELPRALADLQRGNIAPVDLNQAAIGPGMGVFTRFARVLDAEGKPMRVRDALALINRTLDEALAEQEGDFDSDTRWAITWFERSGFDEAGYGIAEQLSKSKNTSVEGLVKSGIVASKRGTVRLLKPDEFPENWDPVRDKRLTAWETVHQLIRAQTSGGDAAAAALLAKIGAKGEIARELAYRLYSLCERTKRATEARDYNGLVQAWTEISRMARQGPAAATGPEPGLFDENE
jgi:putative DNA methylase